MWRRLQLLKLCYIEKIVTRCFQINGVHYDQTQYPLQNAFSIDSSQDAKPQPQRHYTLPLETQLWRYLRHGSEEHLTIYELNLPKKYILCAQVALQALSPDDY